MHPDVTDRPDCPPTDGPWRLEYTLSAADHLAWWMYQYDVSVKQHGRPPLGVPESGGCCVIVAAYCLFVSMVGFGAILIGASYLRGQVPNLGPPGSPPGETAAVYLIWLFLFIVLLVAPFVGGWRVLLKNVRDRYRQRMRRLAAQVEKAGVINPRRNYTFTAGRDGFCEISLLQENRDGLQINERKVVEGGWVQLKEAAVIEEHVLLVTTLDRGAFILPKDCFPNGFVIDRFVEAVEGWRRAAPTGGITAAPGPVDGLQPAP